MSTVKMRDLQRHTKDVIEEVVRSGRPAIITIYGRPQVAVTPLVGAIEAAEDEVLSNAPEHIQQAVREAEADLIGDRASVVDDSVFADLDDEEKPSGEELVAELADQIDAGPLEQAIRSAADAPAAVEAVREALMHVDVFALGSPAEDLASAGKRTVGDFVTYSAADVPDAVLLPVFTGLDALRSALAHQPEWLSLAVFQLNGRELVQQVDPDLTIVVDPWSELEFSVPPSGRRTLMAEQPIVAASELVTGSN
jgi:prevent-host-death family protein